MGVDHRSPDVTMSEKHLNRPYIITGLQEVCGERVAEGVTPDALGKPGPELRPRPCIYRLKSEICFDISC